MNTWTIKNKIRRAFGLIQHPMREAVPAPSLGVRCLRVRAHNVFTLSSEEICHVF